MFSCFANAFQMESVENFKFIKKLGGEHENCCDSGKHN